jgi:hypothetical protein
MLVHIEASTFMIKLFLKLAARSSFQTCTAHQQKNHTIGNIHNINNQKLRRPFCC